MNQVPVMSHVPDDEEEAPQPRSRRGLTRALTIIILLAFALLGFQLWQIQVVRHDYFTQAADTNRFRLLSTDAPRGVIYDRKGQILVRNEPSFNVSIIPADLPRDREEELFKRLSVMLDVPVETVLQYSEDPVGSLASDVSRTYVAPIRKPGLRELISNGRRANPYAEVLIQTNVPRPVAFTLQERALEFPGLRVGVDPVRHYIHNSLTSQILGYVGHIPQEVFNKYRARGYDPTDQVGLTGVELTYEDQLRGTKGRRHVEVDATGSEISSLGEDQPRPGNNLYLTLDVGLEQAVQAALVKGMRTARAKQGAVVVMNPNNGEILALVSYPAYDNNLFATGIKSAQYTALAQDPLHPLVNQAVSGLYPPGSTFKLVPATGALQEGVIDDKTLISDPGTIYVPNKYFPDDPNLAQPFFCWLKTGHGALSIREGIAQSCDVFFYKLVGGFTDFQTGLGETLLADYARQFGFGEATGIDLPGEADGLVPTPQWKRKTIGESWVTGDTYNMAIGQGFVLATPLQTAQMTAVVANGGIAYRPHFGLSIVNAEATLTQTIPAQVIRKLGVDPRNWQIVREGMRFAVTHGTAWRANLADVAVAGKTGTAEYFGPRVNGHLPTHAWFTAFAPYDKPQVVVTVFVFGGGEGSETAAPIAADILRAYFHLSPDSPVGVPEAPPPPETRFTPNQPAARPTPGAGPTVVAPQRYGGRIVRVDEIDTQWPGIQGVVADTAGRGVEGIRVVAERADGQSVLQAVTDTGGAFSFGHIDFNVRWNVRLVGTLPSDSVSLDVAPRRKYILQFSQQ